MNPRPPPSSHDSPPCTGHAPWLSLSRRECLNRLALGLATLGRLDGLGVLHPVLRTASLRRTRVARTAVELVIDEVPSDHA